MELDEVTSRQEEFWQCWKRDVDLSDIPESRSTPSQQRIRDYQWRKWSEWRLHLEKNRRKVKGDCPRAGSIFFLMSVIPCNLSVGVLRVGSVAGEL